MLSASQVADFFIACSHKHGDPISNLKLQKLLYYAQAWHLAIFHTPLFKDEIEAWVHGPVVYSQYLRFKQFSWMDITEEPEEPAIGESEREHLNEVYQVYGIKSAYELELLTHDEDPWKIARGGIPADEPSRNIITPESMEAYYAQRVNV